MVKRLKCWRKGGKNTYVHKSDKKGILISRENSFIVIDFRGKKAPLTSEKFKNRAEVINEAKSYMRKHDTC